MLFLTGTGPLGFVLCIGCLLPIDDESFKFGEFGAPKLEYVTWQADGNGIGGRMARLWIEQQAHSPMVMAAPIDDADGQDQEKNIEKDCVGNDKSQRGSGGKKWRLVEEEKR